MSVRLIHLITGIFLFFLFTSCENDIEKITLLNTSGDYPDIMGENIEVIYTDSGKVTLRLTAPELKQFNNAEKPYSEFPKGINVFFYNDSTLAVETELRADYAVYLTEDKLWHAQGNVIALNHENGDKLESEELYWDEAKEEFYSEKYTRITNESGVSHGQNGFRSDQSFENLELIGYSGVMNIKEDE